jgi:mitochondrial fission protein ELM1
MIFEALSAGLAVGVLAVPTKRSSRITAIAEKLAQRNMITTYKQWCQGKALHARAPLAEAARCAAIILSRWDHQAHKLRADG